MSLVAVIQSVYTAVKAAKDGPASTVQLVRTSSSPWTPSREHTRRPCPAAATADGGWGRCHSWLLAEFTVVAVPRPQSPH